MLWPDNEKRILHPVNTRPSKDLAWCNELTAKFRNELGAVHLGTLAAHAAIGHVAVIEEGGQNLGCIVTKPELKHDPRIFPIIAAAVPHDLQRLQIGLSILHRIACTHRLESHRIMQAKCRVDLPSNKFWQAAGFTCVGVQHSTSARALPLLIWRKCVGNRTALLHHFESGGRLRMGGGRFVPKGQEHLANIIDTDPSHILAAIEGNWVEVERPPAQDDPQGRLFADGRPLSWLDR